MRKRDENSLRIYPQITQIPQTRDLENQVERRLGKSALGPAAIQSQKRAKVRKRKYSLPSELT